MITFFTTAKPFTGQACARQLNALRSWKKVDTEAEILLFGDGEGYDEAAEGLGLKRCCEVLQSQRGVPRIDAMFKAVEQDGSFQLKTYVNADIILLQDFLVALKRIPFKEFLMVAQRTDVQVDERDMVGENWEAAMLSRLSKEGVLCDPTGIDFFAYRGSIWRDLPPLVVGRAGYDNYLIYYCRERRIPVVDASAMVKAIHQKHDYSHLVGGEREVWEGDDAKLNREMAGGNTRLFSIEDADWRLTPSGLRRNWCRGDCRRAADVAKIIARSRGGVIRWIPRQLLEAWYELRSRCASAWDGSFRLLLKYPFWLGLHILRRR